MPLQPLNNYILCRISFLSDTASIVIPDRAKQDYISHGEVLGIGEKVTLPLAIGDKIQAMWNGLIPVDHNDKFLIFIPEGCVLGKIVEDTKPLVTLN